MGTATSIPGPTTRGSPRTSPRGLRLSLLAKHTILVAGVVVITGGTLMLAAYGLVKELLRDQIDKRLKLAARDRQTLLLAYVRQQQERVGLVASRTRLRDLLDQHAAGKIEAEAFRAQTRRILQDAQDGTEGFRSIAVTDARGKVIAATDPEELGREYASTPEYREGLRRAYLGMPLAEEGFRSALLTAPARSPDDRFLGVVVVRIDVDRMREYLEAATLGTSGRILVGRTQDETLRLLVPLQEDPQRAEAAPGMLPALAAAAADRNGFEATRDHRGEQVLAAYRPVGYEGWGMAVMLDQAEAYAPLARLRSLWWTIGALLFVLGLGVSFVAARRMTRPILALDAAADRIAAGDWSARAPVLAADELGDLGAAFNHMAEQLAQSYALLERRVEERTGDLLRERHLLQALQDHIPDSIFFKDEASHYLRINQALARRLGLDEPGEGVGRSDADFFPPDFAAACAADERRILETGTPLIGKEERLQGPDGTVQWFSTTKVPLRNAEGRIIGTFGLSRDITDQKQTQEVLRRAKEAAEAADRAKSEFLANMSHEIRTPMNAILGMTELVLETELAETQRDYLTIVRDSGDALLALINDILDISKIEAGKLDLDRRPFDLADAVGDTMKVLAARGQKKDLEMACRIAPEVPSWVQGDPYRLRQILVNLVGNAVKFTDAGEILLQVETLEEIAGTFRLHFSVADTGIGIEADKLEAIFEMFRQADNSSKRRFAGTGLGLAICRRLVEMMGGRIWAESVPGKGSTFHFTAAFERAAPEPNGPPPETIDLHGLRVLVVDDNASNRRILEEMLQGSGMRPATAPSGAEALVLLKQAHAAGDPFVLVLTDGTMPEMDGFELARRIRAEGNAASTLIMMLTSSDRADDLKRCRALGISSYLTKPIKHSDLLEALQLALRGRQPIRKSGPLPELPHLPPLRILLAEDSLANRKLTLGLLGKQKHQVAVAVNGREALAAWQTGDFDLILMDVQMPEMDGLEATAAIRAAEASTGRRIPIVAMTAHALKGDRERFLAAGMDGYVAKPIRIQELFTTMAAVLGKSATPEGDA